MNKRVYRFAGVLLFAMGLSASYARADIYYTGNGNNPSNPNIFDLTIAAGTYFIEAAGAQGGGTASDPGNGLTGAAGGLGALVGGYVTFTATEELAIVVGGQGNSGQTFPVYDNNNNIVGELSSGGGGGGGSFVYLTSDGITPIGNPLIVAGGGGGAGGSTPGDNGQLSNSGDAGCCASDPNSFPGAGGSAGNGGGATTGPTGCLGTNGDCGAGAGGGWLSAGGSAAVFRSNGLGGEGGPNGSPYYYPYPPGCLPEPPADVPVGQVPCASATPFTQGIGAYGNNNGGAGGGGGGGLLGGGGGGGYSGGGGGCGMCGDPGGGGGSYVDASVMPTDSPYYPVPFPDQAGANAGDGFVIVAAVPEPSSVILLLTELLAIACIAFVARRRIARTNR